MDWLRKIPLHAVLLGALAAGCEPGSVTAPQGVIQGVVLVEGASLEDVIVELTGPQVRSAMTDGAGRYAFDEVPSGAYVISVRSVPDDASFPATSRSAVVSGAQTLTVDFLGNYIRTASIEGSVTSGSQGLSGILVTLEGAQRGTTLTGLGGSFVFSGLRAGQYQVEISGLPESVTFPSRRTEVQLSTGQTFQVTFEGVPELTASVVIRSIERRLPDGTIELADPQNLRGELEVTVTVDRGEDTLTAIDLLLGEEGVGRQTFDIGPGAPTPEAVNPQPVAPLDIVFSVNTAEFDESTGAVRFPNGQTLLAARLATAEGGESAWLSSVQVRLRNVNTFTGGLISDGGPLLGDDGEEWVGGGLTASVLPVLYDASQPVVGITVDLRRVGGSQLRSRTAAGGAPFSVLLEDVGAPAQDNVVGYQTPPGATDQLRVITARYADGSSVPGVPVVLASGLRIDNMGPPPASFALPRQGEGQDCCIGNWVGADFAFARAVRTEPDPGVGGVIATVHAGEAQLPDEELAGQPPVTRGGDLAATFDNTSLRAVAVVRDALGNQTTSPLAPSDGNTLSGPFGAVFGVDLASPQLMFDAASVRNRARNPPSGAAWILTSSDDASGVGQLGARSTVRLLNPAVAGTSAQCVFPGTEPCEPTQDGLLRTIPVGLEGYLDLESHLLDRGGNASNTVTRSVVVDPTPPVVTAVQLPGILLPNGLATISAVASDNLDLSQGWISLEFMGVGAGGAEIASIAGAEILGVPFDDDLVTAGSFAQTVPLWVGLERVTRAGGLDSPSGTMLPLSAARAVVTDAAGHLVSRSEALPGVSGFVNRSFSVTKRGPQGGVADWVVSADTDRVCRSDSLAICLPGTASVVRLQATARGSGGTLERPFDRVRFYVLRGSEPVLIGAVSGAQTTDGAGPLGRSWSWTHDWRPTETAAYGPARLFVIGVDGDGNALRTLDLTSVIVEGGP